MVSIYQIKPKFQALLRPLTNWLASVGVTANQVTVFAAILSMATGSNYLYKSPGIMVLTTCSFDPAFEDGIECN